MSLQQLVLEGFSEKTLRKKAKELATNPGSEYGTLKILEHCLIGFGFDEDRAFKIMSPFHDLNNHRIKLKGHASGSEALELSIKAIKQFGSYHNHFKNLCKDIDESLELIISAFDA